jgi:DNA-binding PadR family transcriptional regulator
MSLSKGSRHGYAMMQDIEQFAGNRLGPGTLYSAIKRLLEKGMIRAEPSADRQRPYRITKTGLNTLETEVEKMRKIVKIGTRRLKF